MNALAEIYGGFKSLLIGLRITLGQFFRPTVTVHYPYQTLTIPPRYRGHIELVADPETGKPLCFVCKLCERACPSDCIAVDGVKFEGDKRKSLTLYQLDFTKCSLCGSCVEVCREGAIHFCRDYNLAGLSKEEFHFDLVRRFWAQQGKPVPALPAPAPKDPAPAAKPQAASPKDAVLPGPKAEPARAMDPKPKGQLAGAVNRGGSPQ